MKKGKKTKYFRPVVLKVEPGENFTVYAYMDDKKIHLYDAKSLLEHPMLESLREPENFKKALTVINGTVAWDLEGSRDARKCIDIDPRIIYNSPVITRE